ncbi:MAG: recombinase family protein [Gammaproteobacteria bacterium]
MSKITAEHLYREAYVYIRQSTVDQVQHNVEGQRRQYGLVERARALGWLEVQVIDEDLGRSGAGIHRPGFERLLAVLCQGHVGAVFCIEASRLARNGRDWHTLLEFCRLVNALLIDEDGIYDPRQPNDRLLLGMKGTLSEMELSTFRQRSQAALMEKAKRGELLSTVAVGYIRTTDDRVEQDPNGRVREGLALVFRKFREFGSVRQVLVWLRQERIELPCVEYSPQGRHLIWKLPVYNTVLKILSNPIYAGAYVFGRTKTHTRIEHGRKRVTKGCRQAQKDWEVLIVDHHEGYISWNEYQSNQLLIADNANMKGIMVRGAVKRGSALLAGLLRCGHCGRKLHVTYCGMGAGCVRYDCRASMVNHGAGRCIAFGGLRADERISQEVLRRLQPLGIRAALQAIESAAHASEERIKHKELALEQAHFEASRARRQYDAVDPENRLVATELERRWNEVLKEQAIVEEELAILKQTQPGHLSEAAQEEIVRLGEDLPMVWDHPAASPELKKRILRVLLSEIVVKVIGNQISMVLHWQGGDHTELQFPKNKTGQHRWKTDTGVEQLIEQLARVMPDQGIASLLNRLEKRTAHGHTWTKARVCSFRNGHRIAIYQEGERQARGELTLEEAASRLEVSKMTVHRLIQKKLLPARHACAGAPWVIRIADLTLLGVKQAIIAGPRTVSASQIAIHFQ